MPHQPVLLQPAQLEQRLATLGDQVPPLIAIHGLMTAIAAGPEAVPPQQWLGYALSREGKMPDLDNHPDGESIVLSLFGWYNDIVAYLESGEFQPYLGENKDPGDESDPLGLWCVGFSKGMHLLEKRWFGPEVGNLAPLLVPIYYFIDPEKFDKMFFGEAPTEDDKDDLAMQMLLQLPLSVVDIHEYWKMKK